MQPKITLRSCCYNHERFLEEALESVRAQDDGDFEWIIVDDASTDDSVKLIRSWLDGHEGSLHRRGIEVQFIAHDENIGFTATLNEILRMARGDYVCGLSCDDRMLPHRISAARRQVEALPPGYAGAYGDAWIIDARGERTGRRFIEEHRNFDRMPEGDLFETLLKANFIPVPSAVVRREALIEVGGYDESLPYEDYDMWLRLSRRFKFASNSEPLVEYRIHDDNMHKKISDWRRINYWIFRKHIDDEAGARRFLGNLKSLHKRGEVPADILEDLPRVDLAGKDEWETLRRSIMGEFEVPCAPRRAVGFWTRLKRRFC